MVWQWERPLGKFIFRGVSVVANPLLYPVPRRHPQTGGGNGGWATIEGKRVVDSCT
jgi:hypothetical protein